jgi:hypothetical protein
LFSLAIQFEDDVNEIYTTSLCQQDLVLRPLVLDIALLISIA